MLDHVLYYATLYDTMLKPKNKNKKEKQHIYIYIIRNIICYTRL